MTRSIPQSQQTLDPRQAPTILVIDDTPDHLIILGDILELEGYQVMYAEDGLSGLNRAQHLKPDLILMDIRMPDIDGFEACRLLKSQEDFRQTTIILMTAQPGSGNITRTIAAGGDDFWEKPIHPLKIRHELKKFFTPQEDCSL